AVHQPVERAAVGAREVLRGDENRFEEPVGVSLLRERDADRVEVLELGEEARLEGLDHRARDARRVDPRGLGDDRAIGCLTRGHLMQTARTCAMSVMPWRTF